MGGGTNMMVAFNLATPRLYLGLIAVDLLSHAAVFTRYD